MTCHSEGRAGHPPAHIAEPVLDEVSAAPTSTCGPSIPLLRSHRHHHNPKSNTKLAHLGRFFAPFFVATGGAHAARDRGRRPRVACLHSRAGMPRAADAE